MSDESLQLRHLCLPYRPWRAHLSLELLCFLSADDNHSEVEDGTIVGGGGSAGRKAFTSGMKEMAVLREKANDQHRQMGKGSKHLPGPEDAKKLRPPSPRTPCQQELDHVLERISTMRLPDERGPLEHLYSLHIPNCDKNGLYNLKQCKMAVNGQRGECWCVNPNTGKLLQGSPTVRGDPECHRYYNERMQ
ncbi:PREDICTED: insulin-like growth factor-binding protein 2 [Miniopterus natalensis]|uniref:insulin-like growth factor-binding protein 2 n=1 Tax=Miniopterus natalensis TaxID=291302 RepID=UPI0007A6BD0A|nr:PREDICTED: insulin-like growth factor-binding protein 2 [Miniopterus natalensis]